MNDNQRAALKNLCKRYNTPFVEDRYKPAFDLPEGYVAGWVPTSGQPIYVGCSPEGDISS